MQSKRRQVNKGQFFSIVKHTLGGVVVAAIMWQALVRYPMTAEQATLLYANVRTLGSTIAQIGGTLAGFQLAALALILSLLDRSLLKQMAESAHLHALIFRMYGAMAFGFAAMLLGLVIMVVPALNDYWIAAITGATMAMFTSTAGVLWKLAIVFFYLRPLPNDESHEHVRVLYADD